MYIHTYKQTYWKKNKEEISITLRALVSPTGHMVTDGVYNYPLPQPIPYYLCLLQAPKLVMAFCLVG